MKIVVSVVLTILSGLYFICHPTVESVMNGTARKIARDPKYLDGYNYSRDIAGLYYWKLGVMAIILLSSLWVIRAMVAKMRSGSKPVNWLVAPALAAVNIYLVLVILFGVIIGRMMPPAIIN